MKKSSEVNEKISVKNTKINIGSIVTFKTHPFDEVHQVKIASYNQFTPPLMSVIEKKYTSTYNIETGEKDVSAYKCIYYSTLKGAFEENWFQENQIKFVRESSSELYLKYKDNNLTKLRKELIGKKAILNTVDLEISKKKVWKDSNIIYKNLKENNLLDYLPPLGVIISVSTNDIYNKYNEKTGKLQLNKDRIIVKLRWLNNKTFKFSELDLPLSTLIIINFKIKDFKNETIYIYDNNKDEKIKESGEVISKVPLLYKDTIFNHYYYKYIFTNTLTNEPITITNDDILNKDKFYEYKKENISAHGSWSEIYAHSASSEETFKEGKWYLIEYSNKNEKYTKRIIYILNIFKIPNTNNRNKGSVLLKANCLLRKGAIRYFNPNRILRSKEIQKNFLKEYIGLKQKE